jgi:hypothetical protein
MFNVHQTCRSRPLFLSLRRRMTAQLRRNRRGAGGRREAQEVARTPARTALSHSLFFRLTAACLALPCLLHCYCAGSASLVRRRQGRGTHTQQQQQQQQATEERTGSTDHGGVVAVGKQVGATVAAATARSNWALLSALVASSHCN